LRINNIDANTAFGRVIRLNPPPSRVEFSSDDRYFGVLHDLENVLNSRGSAVYTRGESNRIREFFKNILGDYNGRNGIMIQKAYGDTVIISGDDFQKINELEKEHGVSYSNISSAKGRKKNKDNRDSKSKEARILIAKEIEKRNENGKYGKPDSKINSYFKIVSKSTKGAPAAYVKFGKFDYSSMHILDRETKFEDTAGTRAHTALRSISYEENELKI